MAVFYGEMQLEGDTNRLPAVVTVERGELHLVSGRTPIGEWKMYQVELTEYTDKSMMLAAEDGRLILFLDEHDKFLRDTEHYRNNPKRPKREKLHPAFRKQAEEETFEALKDEVKQDFNREMNPIIDEARHLVEMIEPGPPLYIALAVLFGLMIFLPSVLVILCTVGAFLALLVGGLGYADAKIAVRIPDPLSPTNLLILGTALLALGIITAIIR